MITVGQLINSAVEQISMAFPDQEREATFADAMQILQIFTMLVKAFVSKAVSDAQMLETEVQQPDRATGDRSRPTSRRNHQAADTPSKDT